MQGPTFRCNMLLYPVSFIFSFLLKGCGDHCTYLWENGRKRGGEKEGNTLTNWRREWVKWGREGEWKGKGRGGSLINNCEAARCRSSGFSLQWAGAGISPSAVSVGLIREPLGTWQKLLAGCDGRIRRTHPPPLHHHYSLHPCFLPNSLHPPTHCHAPHPDRKEGKGVKEEEKEGDHYSVQTPPTSTSL